MSNRVRKPVFTQEMRKNRTLLFPDMVPIHFRLLEQVLRQSGYNAKLLDNEGPGVTRCGQKYVHNDTCYPALLTIGQMLDVLDSGKYKPEEVCFVLPQTGGGCRASNYIFLLRKALRDAGYEDVPVVSLNLSGMDKQPGFSLTVPLLNKMLLCMAYGDLLMCLANQVRPYEDVSGMTDQLVNTIIAELTARFEKGKDGSIFALKRNAASIAARFHEIPVHRVPKVKTGIVGEIYVKYSSLANNHLCDFLQSQDCEVMVPGIMSFLLYAADMPLQDAKLYGGSRTSQMLSKVMYTYLHQYEKIICQAIRAYPEFTVPASYDHLKALAEPLIGIGCKMGEGWLLTAEMAELIESGYPNIVCTQPFGCLPNHIAGKAMIRKLSQKYESANIVAIDYDPGATRVNQENRIKLMLSIGREKLQDEVSISK